jgi:hypothetical protein
MFMKCLLTLHLIVSSSFVLVSPSSSFFLERTRERGPSKELREKAENPLKRNHCGTALSLLRAPSRSRPQKFKKSARRKMLL